MSDKPIRKGDVVLIKATNSSFDGLYAEVTAVHGDGSIRVKSGHFMQGEIVVFTMDLTKGHFELDEEISRRLAAIQSKN